MSTDGTFAVHKTHHCECVHSTSSVGFPHETGVLVYVQASTDQKVADVYSSYVEGVCPGRRRHSSLTAQSLTTVFDFWYLPTGLGPLGLS